MDFLLKQRLVGAVVLVALGVIFIPMLLEGPEQPVVPAVSEMPAPESLPEAGELQDFPGGEEIVPTPPVSIVTDKRLPSPAGDRKSKAPAPGADLPKPDEPPPAADAGPGQAGQLQGWVVQVGSFSKQENALALRDRLRKAGFATQVEKVRLDKGTRFRVRVGPYLQRAEADRAQAGLKKKFDLSARVMTYP